MTTLVSLEQRFGAVSAVVQSCTSVFFTAPVRFLAGVQRRLQKRNPMEREFNPRLVRSILLTRLDGLGDMVLFSSFVREVRGLWPDAHITLVVDKKFVAFVEQCPHVNEIIGFDERGSKYARLFTGPVRALRLARQCFWPREIDLAISPRWDFDTRHAAVLNFLSLPRYHFGFSEKVSRRKQALNYGLDRLFSHVVPSKTGVCHEIDRNAEMLKAVGGNPARIRHLELWLSTADRDYATHCLVSGGVVNNQPLICFGVGATQAKRCWPIERFAEIGQRLVATYGAKILVLGDAADGVQAERLRPLLGSALINQAGVCNVRQSAALMSLCNAFVGNDSGPMHLAAAANLPVIGLSCHPESGPQDHINSPFRYAPVSAWARVLQPAPLSSECLAGCNQSEAHCILNLHLSDVNQLVNDLMSNQALTQSNLANAGA